jgi:hypothetical protein
MNSPLDALTRQLRNHQGHGEDAPGFLVSCMCGEDFHSWDAHRAHAAESALNEGWCAPPREISDTTELDALPFGTVVQCTDGMNRVFVRDLLGWYIAGPIRAVLSAGDVLYDGQSVFVLNMGWDRRYPRFSVQTPTQVGEAE